jgi:hypothetical protein
MDEVTDIDRGNRKVFLRGGHVLSYDYLILAAGSTSSYFGHNEWSKYAPSLKSIEEALDIRTRVLLIFERAEKEVGRGGPQPQWTSAAVSGRNLPPARRLARRKRPLRRTSREVEEDSLKGSGITLGLREQAHFLCARLPAPERCSHRA